MPHHFMDEAFFYKLNQNIIFLHEKINLHFFYS
jgi:hypothetical protein